MRNTPNEKFEFVSSDINKEVTFLQATMVKFAYDNHAHEDLALGVTLEGIQEFVCNASTHRSAPGDIIIIRPGDVHNGHSGSNTILRYAMLYCCEDELLGLMKSLTRSSSKKQNFQSGHFSDPRIRNSILNIGNIISKKQCPQFEYDRGVFQLAEVLAQKHCMYYPAIFVHKKDTIFKIALEYINDNIENDISINELSNITNISKYHFIRIFRNQFGLSPHQYILNCKINKARAGLIRGLSPTYIAHQLGFFDVSHLNRIFKRSFGLTPKQFQLQIIGKYLTND